MSRPGIVERALVVFVILINQFGTPASWFTSNTGSNSGPSSDPLLTIGTLLVVSVLSLTLVGNGDALIRAVFADSALSLFVLVLIVSPLWSSYFAESLTSAVNLALMFTFAIVLLVRYSIKEIMGLAAVASGIGIILDGIWVMAMGPLGRTPAGWDGLGTQKNALGNHGVVAVLVFVFASRLYPQRRFTLGTLTAIAFVLTIGSQSKTSLAAGMLTVVSMMVYVVFRSKRTLFGAVLISISSTSVAALAFATANIGLIAGWLDKDVTLTGRTDFWPIIIDAVKNRPFLGYGIDGYFRGPLSSAFDIEIGGTFVPTHAHNALLQVGLHSGVVGMTIFAVLNVRSVIRSVNHARWVPGAAGLFPLVYLTLAIMLSITESGVLAQRFGFTLFVVSVIRARIGVEEAVEEGLVRMDRIDA